MGKETLEYINSNENLQIKAVKKFKLPQLKMLMTQK